MDSIYYCKHHIQNDREKAHFIQVQQHSICCEQMRTAKEGTLWLHTLQ